MGIHCTIVGCHVNSTRCKGVSFHKLPKEGTGNNEWRRQLIDTINRSDSSFNPNNAAICSRHFLPSCFRFGPSGRKTLVPGSLPTEFINAFQISGNTRTSRKKTAGICTEPDSDFFAWTTVEIEIDVAEDMSATWTSTLSTSTDTTGEWAGNMQGAPGTQVTQSSTASTAVDTDRQVRPLTAPEACQTMQPVLLRDSTTLRGIKAEPVTHTETAEKQSVTLTDTGSSDYINNGFVIKIEPVTDTDAATDSESEPTSDTDMWADIKNEPVTDSDTRTTIKREPDTVSYTWTNIKSEPATDADTCTTVKFKAIPDVNTSRTFDPVDDAAVCKTGCAVSMEPLPLWDGQERLSSEPQPADRETWTKPCAATSEVQAEHPAHCDQTPILQTSVKCMAAPFPLNSSSVGHDGSDDCEKQVKTKNDLKPFVCEVCGKGFKWDFLLKKHGRVHLGIKRYACDECNKAFIRPSELKRHKQIHAEPPHVCDVCNRFFRHPTHLKNHKKAHKGISSYVCDVCCKVFTKEAGLQKHRKIHTGDKPFVCDVCNKAFRQLCSMKDHRQTHSAIRPYVCEVCSKAFTMARYLKGHRLIHTGVKAYVCDVCSKGFSSSSYLKDHRKIHSGVKPYVCDVCSKTFATAFYLKEHKKIHSETKSFVCGVCSKAFTTAQYLRKHMRVHTR